MLVDFTHLLVSRSDGQAEISRAFDFAILSYSRNFREAKNARLTVAATHDNFL